jgi:hypothetical protein
MEKVLHQRKLRNGSKGSIFISENIKYEQTNVSHTEVFLRTRGDSNIILTEYDINKNIAFFIIFTRYRYKLQITYRN